jgi:hypothetical protein
MTGESEKHIVQRRSAQGKVERADPTGVEATDGFDEGVTA